MLVNDLVWVFAVLKESVQVHEIVQFQLLPFIIFLHLKTLSNKKPFSQYISFNHNYNYK